MFFYKYLCFILLTAVCYIDAEFVLTKNRYTWSDANQTCTLATPHLTFSKNDITPDLDIRPSADAWLGYTENMTSFEYFGCAKKTDLHVTTANYTTEGDPGKCWSACNNGRNVEAIAVNGNECYCLQTVNAGGNKLKKSNCDKGCPGQPKIVCGDRNNHVALYKTTYTGPITMGDLESDICLWHAKFTPSYVWGNCTEGYRILCYRGTNVWEYNDGDNYNNWITLTTKCFESHGIPSNYNKTEDLNITGKDQKWTGIIRNGVIYSMTYPTNGNAGKYGYVDRTTRQLLFANDSTVRKRAFCVKGTIVTVETTTSAVEAITSTGTTIEDTTDENKTGSSDVGAIVGATVAIIIVIIVVLVLVVLWKRGMKFPLKKARKLEKEKTQATNMTYNFARPDDTIQGTDESSFTNYAEVDVSKMTPDTGVTQTGDAKRTSACLDEPHPYFVLEKGNEGTYDTTKTTPQIHDQHTLNPYNKVSLEESSSYDHIGAHGNDSKTLGLDSPYNTTTLASSNKYNGFTNNAFNRNDGSDDTYNHIDGQLRQTECNQSDNPYNTTTLGHLQNDHGVNNNAFNSNDECDDTYNHISDQSGQNDQTITDNPYNTTTLGDAQTNGVNNSTFNNNDDSENTYNHIYG